MAESKSDGSVKQENSIGKRKMFMGHVKSVLEGKKSIACIVCNATFASKPNLKRHIASIHEGKKPFKCDLCPISFVSKMTLDRNIA